MDSNLVMWTLVAGFFMVPVVGLIKQSKWSEQAKAVLTFLVALVVAAGTVYFEQPDWNWRDYVSTALIVLVTAISTYHGFWKPSGIEPKISEITDRPPSP